MNCICCNAHKTRVVFKWSLNGSEISMRQCLSCGFWYQEPIATPDVLAALYDEEFFSVYEKHFISFRVRQFKKDLKSINELKAIKGKLLDIGCALGLFLNEAKQDGWDVTGSDVSEKAARYVLEKYGIKVFLGDLERENLEDDCFDVVTAWDVIEHVRDPQELLKAANRILKQGGLLVIRTPNSRGLFLKAVMLVNLIPGEYLAKIAPRFKHHIYLFSARALTLLLNKSGFDIIRIEKDVEDLIIVDQPGISNNLKAAVRKIIKLIEYLMPTYRDSIVVYARRR